MSDGAGPPRVPVAWALKSGQPRTGLPGGRGASAWVPSGHTRSSILADRGQCIVLPCAFPVTPSYTPESQDGEVLASEPLKPGPPSSVPSALSGQMLLMNRRRLVNTPEEDFKTTATQPIKRGGMK